MSTPRGPPSPSPSARRAARRAARRVRERAATLAPAAGPPSSPRRKRARAPSQPPPLPPFPASVALSEERKEAFDASTTPSSLVSDSLERGPRAPPPASLQTAYAPFGRIAPLPAVPSLPRPLARRDEPLDEDGAEGTSGLSLRSLSLLSFLLPAPSPPPPASLLPLVLDVLEAGGGRTALAYANDVGQTTARLSYSALWERAEAVANALVGRWRVRRGSRVLLVFPPGLDFVPALLGVWMAGCVAVPAPAPVLGTDGDVGVELLRAIAEDCTPAAALTTGDYAWNVRQSAFRKSWPKLTWHATPSLDSPLPSSSSSSAAASASLSSSALPAHRFAEEGGAAAPSPRSPRRFSLSSPRRRAAALPASPSLPALVQYTAGTTSSSVRGALLSHGALLRAVLLTSCASGFRHGAAEKLVCASPPHRGAGLVLGVLAPIVHGAEALLLSPAHLSLSPDLFPRALSLHRATVSVCPARALDAVAAAWTPLPAQAASALLALGGAGGAGQQLPHDHDGVDLSSVRVVYVTGDVLRPRAARAFAAALEGSGLRGASVLRPTYGLVEAGWGVCVSASALRTFTGTDGVERSCAGAPLHQASVDLRVVDPATSAPLPPGAVGEVWLRSPSAASGYYGCEPFDAAVGGGGGGGFVRTGDLGAMVVPNGGEAGEGEEELVVVGRLAEAIRVRGRLFFAPDVEAAAVDACGGLLRPHRTAAVLLGGDEVAVVAELDSYGLAELFVAAPTDTDRRASLEALCDSIRSHVHASLELRPQTVVLLRADSLPHTFDGVLMRGATRDALLEGGLPSLHDSTVAAPVADRWWEGEGETPGGEAERLVRDHQQQQQQQQQQVSERDEEEAAGAAGGDDGGLNSTAALENILVEFKLGRRDLTAVQNGLDSLRLAHLIGAVRRATGVELQVPFVVRHTVAELCDAVLMGAGGAGEALLPPRRITAATAATPRGRPLPRPLWHLLQAVGAALLLLVAAACSIPAYHLAKWASDTLPKPFGPSFRLDGGDAGVPHMFGLVAFLAVPCFQACLTAAVVLSKWLVVGRHAPCRLRHRSLPLLRWWWCDRLSAFWWALAGRFLVDTALLTAVYRAMGARLAPDARVSLRVGEPDLLAAGPRARVDAAVYCRAVDAGGVWMDRVRVGADANLRAGAVVMPGCDVADGARVEALAVVLPGSSLAEHADRGSYEGNPAVWVPRMPGAGSPPPPQQQQQQQQQHGAWGGAGGGRVDLEGVVVVDVGGKGEEEDDDDREHDVDDDEHEGEAAALGEASSKKRKKRKKGGKRSSSAGDVAARRSRSGTSARRRRRKKGGKRKKKVRSRSATSSVNGATTASLASSSSRRSRSRGSAASRHTPRSPAAAASAAASASSSPRRKTRPTRARTAAPPSPLSMVARAYEMEEGRSASPARSPSAANRNGGSESSRSQRAQQAPPPVRLTLGGSRPPLSFWLEEGAKLLLFLALLQLVNLCGAPMRALLGEYPLPSFRYEVPLFFALVYLSSVLLLDTAATALFKWALFGRVRPGLYRDNAWRRLCRWWMMLLSRVGLLFGLFFVYTKYGAFRLRALGARGLWRSMVVAPQLVAPHEADLVRVKYDDVFISNVTAELDYPMDGGGGGGGDRREGGWRRRAELELHSGVSVGLQSRVRPCVVGAGSAVGARTYLQQGTRVPPRSTAYGSPLIVSRAAAASSAEGASPASTLRGAPFRDGAGGAGDGGDAGGTSVPMYSPRLRGRASSFDDGEMTADDPGAAAESSAAEPDPQDPLAAAAGPTGAAAAAAAAAAAEANRAADADGALSSADLLSQRPRHPISGPRSRWGVAAVDAGEFALALAQLAVLLACVVPAWELARYVAVDVGVRVEVTLLLLSADFVVFGAAALLATAASKHVAVGRHIRPQTLHMERGELYGAMAVRFRAMARPTFFVRAFVQPLLHGTEGACAYHRLCGADVGRGVQVYTVNVQEQGMLNVEDGAVLDDASYVMAHELLVGRMRLAPVRIGAGAVLAPHAMCLAGDEVRAGGTLGAGSKCFPGQAVGAKERWRGNPASRVRRE